jgi:hypothetical protein
MTTSQSPVMSSVAIKVYTVLIALICGATLAWSIDQQHVAATSAADARGWRHLAKATVAHDRATTHANKVLVARYNRLVHRTAAAQRRLLRAIKDAQSAAATAGTPATVYHTVSGRTVSAPSSGAATATPAPTPVSTPPTTRTS